MRRITKKEFDYYFENYASLLEKGIRIAVACQIEKKGQYKSMEYDAMLDLMNAYWHLAQDFRPLKYFHKWLRKELGCIDGIFEKIGNEHEGKEFEKVMVLHGKSLVEFVEGVAGPDLEEFKKGTLDYAFYKRMKEKGDLLLSGINKSVNG